jgi:LDH2 family malate/lactate/ureidoglycolate dehydrogenase
MRISITEIRTLCEGILTAKGLSQKEAAIITDDYLDAEMRGKPSHGLAGFSVVVDDAKKRGKSHLAFQRGPIAFLEGNGDIGHLVAHQAVGLAGQMTAEFGVAVVGMKNITRFATPGSIARLAAEKNLIALIFEYGGKALMTPYGAADPILSTNPIGIGIPTEDGPIILDMASSERAYYFISLAQKLGQSIPLGWGVDGDGQGVTDPSKVKAVLPFGGYKGSGLAFMLEILTGPFLGVDVGLKGDLSRRGALGIFFSPAAFGVPAKDFNAKVREFVRNIKNAGRAPGHEVIWIPGEQGEIKRREALKKGELEISEQVYQSLQGLK